MYGLRRVSVILPSFLMSACTTHLLNLPLEPATSHLKQGLNDLQAMSTNHPFALRCIENIRTQAAKWNIPLPENEAFAAASRLKGQLKLQSPVNSSFFAASGPRKTSSAGARSGSSSDSHHGSPFAPFPAPQSQQHPGMMPFNSGMSTPIDPNQAQHGFWTPYLGQPMQNVPPHVVPSMDMDMAAVESDHGQWQVFGNVDRSQSHMNQDWSWQ